MPKGEEKHGLIENILRLLQAKGPIKADIRDGLYKMNANELLALNAQMVSVEIKVKPFQHEE